MVGVVCDVCVSVLWCLSFGCWRGASVRVAHQRRRVVLAPVLRQTTVLLVALRLRDLLGLGLVVVGPEALALAGGDHADFVSPSVAVGTLQLHPPRPGVGRDAAVVRGAAPPPLAAADGVGHEVRRHALARTHQLLHGLGTAARSVGDVTGGAQLPTAQLRGTVGDCVSRPAAVFRPVIHSVAVVVVTVDGRLQHRLLRCPSIFS